MNSIYKIVILGPQGSGKGTQAEVLAQKLNLPLISVGQLLRDEVARNSPLVGTIQSNLNKGILVPHEIVNQLVQKKLTQASAGFIFDGYPRSLSQAQFLDKITNLSHVIIIDISDEEAVQRLAGRRTCSKCGKIFHLKYNPPQTPNTCDDCGSHLEIRADDTEAAIKERLQIYHEETEAVIEHYQKKGLVIKIDGSPTIPEVTQQIFSKLNLK